jgi:hypothetical protein
MSSACEAAALRLAAARAPTQVVALPMPELPGCPQHFVKLMNGMERDYYDASCYEIDAGGDGRFIRATGVGRAVHEYQRLAEAGVNAIGAQVRMAR